VSASQSSRQEAVAVIAILSDALAAKTPIALADCVIEMFAEADVSKIALTFAVVVIAIVSLAATVRTRTAEALSVIEIVSDADAHLIAIAEALSVIAMLSEAAAVRTLVAEALSVIEIVALPEASCSVRLSRSSNVPKASRPSRVEDHISNCSTEAIYAAVRSSSPAEIRRMSPVAISFEAANAPCIRRLPEEDASNKPQCVTVPQLPVAAANSTLLVLSVVPPEAASNAILTRE